jgi:superfamily II DNA or RNA helicase
MQIQLYNSYSKIVGNIEPALFKALRDSLSYIDGERIVHLYVARQPGLGWCFPTGLIAQVIEVISMHGGTAPEIEDRRRHVPNSEVIYHWNTDYNLRAYQHTAVAKMVAKTRGIAWMGTGGGKTITSARIIHNLGRRAFVCVISTDAWMDTVASYRSYLGNSAVAVWGGKFKDIGDVTVVTIQALTQAKQKPNSILWRAFQQADLVILDEVHMTAGGGQWGQCIMESPAYYKFGMTGSPYRGKDDNDILLRAATGRIQFIATAVDLQEQGHLAQSEIIFHSFSMVSDLISYEYKDAIVLNAERNQFVADLVKSITTRFESEGKAVPVMAISVQHIEHAEILAQMTGFVVYHGQLPTPVKAAIRSGLKDGSLRGIVATGVLTASADYPQLKIMIDASAFGSHSTLVQKKGRELRQWESEIAEYHGIIDEFVGNYRQKSLERVEHFKKEGWEVKII